MINGSSLQGNPILFICDLQEKFRAPIYEFSKCVSTAEKLLRASKILSIPVYATVQNKARLGDVVPELTLDHAKGVWDKTLFSMMIPEIKLALSTCSSPCSVAIVGIETHICVTQTTLDLLSEGHKVYVIADGVSSCNPTERGIALARLRSEGAIVTSSESWLYEVMGDASIPEFKQIAALVKETKTSTSETVQTLL